MQDGTELGLTDPQGGDTGPGFIPDADPTTTTNPLDDDSDDDGLLEGNEDVDGNGRAEQDETDAADIDTDDDLIQDGTEQGLSQPEGDGTGPEFIPDADPGSMTDPLDADSDDDGLLDGEEDENQNGQVAGPSVRLGVTTACVHSASPQK